jgi:hypothetical protein
MYDGQNELETKIKADSPNGKEIKYSWMPRFYSDTPVSIARFNSDEKIKKLPTKEKMLIPLIHGFITTVKVA